MASRSQTFVTALPRHRNSVRPAPVKGKSSIRQGATAYPLILIFPDPLHRLPPLRERREDILPLAQRFLRQAAGEKAVPVLSGEARDALLAHAWPGNARELRNVMERALLLAEGSAVRRDDLPPALQGVGGAASGGATADEGRILTLAEVEEAQIRKVLGLGVSMDKAAALLGITTVTLWRKRKELGLD